MIDDVIKELSDVVSTADAIAALGESRATWYRRHRQSPVPEKPERVVLSARQIDDGVDTPADDLA